MTMKQVVAMTAITFGIVTSLSVIPGAAQAPTADQMVAALKQNLAGSQKRLRQYEWIETTALSLKGEGRRGSNGASTTVPTANSRRSPPTSTRPQPLLTTRPSPCPRDKCLPTPIRS